MTFDLEMTDLELTLKMNLTLNDLEMTFDLENDLDLEMTFDLENDL